LDESYFHILYKLHLLLIYLLKQLLHYLTIYSLLFHNFYILHHMFLYFFYIQSSYSLIYVKLLHIDGAFSNHFAVLILIVVFLVIFVLSQMYFPHLLLFVIANLLFSDNYF